MKGNILDVYKEGCDTFRACVLEVVSGDDQLAKVVNLDTGEIETVKYYECETPVINNVFDL